MYGDNFQVIVHSEGIEHFKAAIEMCFAGHAPGGKARYFINGLPERPCAHNYCGGTGVEYRVPTVPADPERPLDSIKTRCEGCGGTGKAKAQAAMVLLWEKPSGDRLPFQRLPYEMKVKPATTFLWEWLQQCEYPNEPDHDGSNGAGFFITTGDFWGHIEGLSYSIVMVVPEWQMYGK